MIWFACRQCGKTHGRAENDSGTLVFCECGRGNRVPPTSTAPEPAAPPAGAPPSPAPSPRPIPERVPPESAGWRRSWQPIRIDLDRCLNHADRPRTTNCDSCREPFCAACVVALGGRTLCGPCKDFQVRAARRPRQMSGLAIVSCVLGILAGGPAFCLPVGSAAAQANGVGTRGGFLALGLVAITLPLTALILGMLALRDIETKPNVAGRPTALTGTIAAGVGLLWCVVVYTALAIKHAGG
jgi:hypothetical protein